MQGRNPGRDVETERGRLCRSWRAYHPEGAFWAKAGLRAAPHWIPSQRLTCLLSLLPRAFHLIHMERCSSSVPTQSVLFLQAQDCLSPRQSTGSVQKGKVWKGDL